MAKIDPSLYLHNQKERTPSPELGKDEFLKILMTQLQHQDPTNPMDDRQFISQMAEFSSLEQMMNMTKSIDTLVQSQLISPVIKYSHMLGKEVTYQAYDEETGKEAGLKTSKVVAVSQSEGWAILELENGEKIYADAALQVNDPEFEEPPSEDDQDEANKPSE
ncbi:MULTISPECIES: flagellar hook assembly protein FlgD [Clostridia]|uniref:flagellar hook assembly protein FlgD n=1 Tax=Clostridia TaxID=186801 RepID=UPI000EA15CEA|nr:flagellar hook assembly protein FlgD [Clostridium sp. 1xD42-85]NBJ68399.1 flagellar hook assembly protein FlgD [Roseburia sp. 1XD42-34]RKI81487.1 flagellar hook assembly protein FlgD [Clostridium sp. 1xD42-85]